MLGLRMVTAKKSTKRQAVRSSAEAIMGGSRSANAARGPAGCALDELLGHGLS